MKCPSCNSKVDHTCLVNGPKGEEYYVCPNCERQLVHQSSFGQVALAVVIALPVLTFILEFLLSASVGQLLSDVTIMGFEAVSAISLSASIVAVIVLAKTSIRLVEH